jgi:superfamily II DNA or RNA helicase
LPRKLELVLSSELFIRKDLLPPALRNRLIRLAAFQNPEFYRAQAMRRPTYDTSRIVGCARDYPHSLGLPRGCLEELRELLSGLKVPCVVRDERFPGKALNVSFQGELRPEQRVAAETMLAHETGVLSATTAFGKTVIGAWLIAKRAVNTLVLVHRRQLQEQWIERLSKFLGLPPDAIGRVGGGRRMPTGILDVATIQSLVHKGVVDDIVANYGHLVVDECHHLSAYSFEQVARHAKAKFVTGLSATVTRKDGHHPIIFMQCGPLRYRVNAREQAAAQPFEHTVLVRPTGFRTLRVPNPDLRTQFRELTDELVCDEDRTRLICQEIVQAVRDRRSPIVLTERNDHLDKLIDQLAPEIKHVVVLRGGMSRKEIANTRAASGHS